MSMLEIRKDRTPAVLRKVAKAERDARVQRRILAIANALAGMSRKDAAGSAGMDRQTLRDWVIRYNAHGVAGLVDLWKGGRPARLTPQEQAELLAIVMAGPDPDRDGFSAFTRDDLVAVCENKFGKGMHPTSMTHPLRSTAITAASSLLRSSPPLSGASVLSASRL